MKKAGLSMMTLFMFSLFLVNVQAQIKTDYNKEKDFSQFKTYSFAGWQANCDRKLNEFDKKRILESLKSEFDARGMTLKKEGADIAVVLYIVVETKTSTTAYTDYTRGLGYGPRWGWGMGYATTTYSENDYLEGTLVVDVYDTSDQKLAWQGTITTMVKEKPQKREKSIPKKMKKLMAKYPVTKQK